jgi:magnesium-transporting ATPase (P-type)
LFSCFFSLTSCPLFICHHIPSHPITHHFTASHQPEYRFDDPRLLHELTSAAAAPARRALINEYLTLLATCNSVVPGFEGCTADHMHALPGSGCSGKLKYQAASPDELALVEAALDEQYFLVRCLMCVVLCCVVCCVADFEYHELILHPSLCPALLPASCLQHSRLPATISFRSRTVQGNRLTVNVRGAQCQFDVLELLPFTSDRKRMSVLIFDHRDRMLFAFTLSLLFAAHRLPPPSLPLLNLSLTYTHTTEQIKLYCKGADNVIRARATAASLQATWPATEQHLKRFAADGLRTLVCGYRVISGEEFDAWYPEHCKAKASMANREAEEAASAERLERELVLLGSTAIEDRLQEGVSEAIEKLAKADIKVCGPSLLPFLLCDCFCSVYHFDVSIALHLLLQRADLDFDR